MEDPTLFTYTSLKVEGRERTLTRRVSDVFTLQGHSRRPGLTGVIGGRTEEGRKERGATGGG